MITVIDFGEDVNYSLQKEIIYRALVAHPCHPTAGQVYAMLKKDYPKLSLATVYRNLRQMADGHQIRRIEGLTTEDHFDHKTHPHYHFICKVCGKVSDVSDEVAPALSQKIQETLNVQVDSCDITASGLCLKCQH